MSYQKPGAMRMGLHSVLQKVVRRGDLMLRLPGGGTLRLGDGTGPALIARITSAGWAARIAAKPGLGVGEAYMDGGLVLEQGDRPVHRPHRCQIQGRDY